MTQQQAVTVLGATGSIGMSTLDVLTRHRDQYQVFALSAHRQWRKLFELCLQHHPRYAVLAEPEAAQALREQLRAHLQLALSNYEDG